jgi:hypothetical protein
MTLLAPTGYFLLDNFKFNPLSDFVCYIDALGISYAVALKPNWIDPIGTDGVLPA